MIGTKSSSLSPLSSLLGLDGPFQKGLMFLLQLAWESRIRLPVLITVGFMVLDIRMQLEINVDVDVHGQVDDVQEDDDEDEHNHHTRRGQSDEDRDVEFI